MIDLSQLISRYSETLSVKSITKAYHDDLGDLIPETETIISISGAIQPITGQMQRNDTAGTYTSLDKVMYTTQELQLKSIVTYKGEEYEIMEKKDYSELGNYYQYVIRGTSYQ